MVTNPSQRYTSLATEKSMKINDISTCDKKYQVIYADPPWNFNSKKTGGSMKSGASQQYDCMSLAELKSIPVPDIAADDCLLVMWWVGAMPQEAIDLVNAWGFTLKNMNGFVWNKLTQNNIPFFGMGFYTRAGSESCLIATKGKFKPAKRNIRAVFHSEAQVQFESRVMAHSKKPVQVRDLIVELAGDVPRVELFARTAAAGWDRWGNQA